MAFPKYQPVKHQYTNVSCTKGMRWIPVLFIITIVAWSYYAYVVELALNTISSTTKRVAYLTIYHGLIIMFFWTYLRTIFTEVGTVPETFKLSRKDYEQLEDTASEESFRRILETRAKNLPITNLSIGGSVRYCKKCRHLKSDRAHHCSVCEKCVLKMDHHCPWINNCVCFTNYKFFILFLVYSLIYCVFVAATTAEYFVVYWKRGEELSENFHVLFLFFVAVTFAVSLVSLFGYHCHLVRHNRTTLEAFRPAVFESGPDKDGFDLGACRNFQEVFGTNVKTWFIPVPSGIGDGVVYGTRLKNPEYFRFG